MAIQVFLINVKETRWHRELHSSNQQPHAKRSTGSGRHTDRGRSAGSGRTWNRSQKFKL